MYKILKKESLNPTVTLMEIDAPLVAKKAEPGQFIILRVDENGERIPLTIADFDREQRYCHHYLSDCWRNNRGAQPYKMKGEYLRDFRRPAWKTHPEAEGLKKVAVVGGGVGCAIAYPIAKKLHEQGC